MKSANEENRRTIRALISAYLISWLAVMTISVVVTDYEVSGQIAAYSWRVFTIASVVNIALIWISAIGLFFFAAWARSLFLVNVFYSLAYTYVFGGGSGSPMSGLAATVNTMLAGAILFAVYIDSPQSSFFRPNGKHDVQ